MRVSSSVGVEKSETFGFGGGGVSVSDFEGVWLEVGPGVEVAEVLPVGFFFFCGFRATERGLNIIGLPIVLGSCAGFSSAVFSVVGRSIVVSPFSTSRGSFSSVASEVKLGAGSRLKPTSELVFRLTPLPSPIPFEAPLAPVFFGAGSIALNPPKLPAVFAFLAGRSSSCSAISAFGAELSGRFTRIF